MLIVADVDCKRWIDICELRREMKILRHPQTHRRRKLPKSSVIHLYPISSLGMYSRRLPVFLSQDLIPYCYSSCCSYSCWSSKKAEGSVTSKLIRLKLGLFVSTGMYQMTGVDFGYDIICHRWQLGRHFMQKSAAIW